MPARPISGQQVSHAAHLIMRCCNVFVRPCTTSVRFCVPRANCDDKGLPSVAHLETAISAALQSPSAPSSTMCRSSRTARQKPVVVWQTNSPAFLPLVNDQCLWYSGCSGSRGCEHSR